MRACHGDRIVVQHPERPASAEWSLQPLLKIDDAQPQTPSPCGCVRPSASALRVVLRVSAAYCIRSAAVSQKTLAGNACAYFKSPPERVAEVSPAAPCLQQRKRELASALWLAECHGQRALPGELFKREQPRRRVQIPAVLDVDTN